MGQARSPVGRNAIFCANHFGFYSSVYFGNNFISAKDCKSAGSVRLTEFDVVRASLIREVLLIREGYLHTPGVHLDPLELNLLVSNLGVHCR